MILYSKGIDIMSNKINKKQVTEIKNDQQIISNNKKINESTEYYQILSDEKNHNLLKIFSSIILILTCVLLFYYLVILNSKAIMASGINKVYQKITTVLSALDDSKILVTPTTLDTTSEITSNNPDFNYLTNGTYSLNMGINTYHKEYYTNLLTNNGDNLLDGAFIKNTNGYYLKLNMDNEYIIKVADSNDYLNYLPYIDYLKLASSIKDIKNIIINRIEINKLKKGQENGYNYVSLNMTSSEASNLLSLIIGDIKTNHSLKNKLMNAFNADETVIDNYLDNILKKYLTVNYDTIEFKVYTSGYLAKVVGLTISTDNMERLRIFNDQNLIINYQFKEQKITYENNNLKINTPKYNGNIKINELNKDLIDLDYDINNTKGNIHLTINKDNNDYTGELLISYQNDTTTSLNLSYHLISNTNVDIPEFDNADYLTTLSEDDYLNIYNNLNKNIKNKLLNKYLIDYLQGLMA
jgi:hypothetical protein